MKSGDEFRRVLDEKAFAADDHLVVNVTANTLGYTRLGITVPKRVGNAPLRNRWKRLVREAFRLQKKQLPLGLDMVVRPRKGAKPDFARIQQSLLKLVQRAVKKR